MTTERFFEDADLIHAYTRAEALEDGTLIDLTVWASSENGFAGGFRVPVAVTSAVWGMIEAIPAGMAGIQDIRGRAHDVLWMASLAARAGSADGRTRVAFRVLLPCRGTRKRSRTLLVDIGGGDNGEPVVTIGERGDF